MKLRPYFDMVKPPYTNYLWLTGIKPFLNNGKPVVYRGLLEKMIIANDSTAGKAPDVIPQSALTPTDLTTPFVCTMFCGYINREMIKSRINHIAANKGSRAISITCEC